MDIKRLGLSFTKTIVDNRTDEAFSLAVELVEKLFFNMAKLCTKYDNMFFFDLPYTYKFSERRLDSVILPALSKLCNSMVLVEVPTERYCSNRKFKIEKTIGRIDYMCVYKGYSFVIELKHSFDCFHTNNTREKGFIDRWIKMNEQLESAVASIKEYEELTKGVIRIGLHIVTSYASKSPSSDIIADYNDRINSISNRYIKHLGKKYPSLKPDLILGWKIPQRLIYGDELTTMPGLWSIAKIYAPIKHKGAK